MHCLHGFHPSSGRKKGKEESATRKDRPYHTLDIFLLLLFGQATKDTTKACEDKEEASGEQ